MLAQRVAQQSLRRRLAIQRPGAFSALALNKSIAPSTPLAILNGSHQRRLAATTNIPQDQGHDILVRQRRNRPVSPHLGIYRPQITWLASAFNRLTGSVLSGAFYIFGFGYLVQPLLGVHIFESSSLIAGFAAMPLWAKVPVKFTLSLFFTFHGFNGVRHLIWDTGRQFKNPQVIRSGWIVVGLSVVSALGLTFY